MNTPVSVVVITKNEEKRLAKCLESAIGWAGEIIVVDDESADRTREIAAKYADKILVRKMDNEGRHRNWAYSQAKYDWVFSLDADEVFTSGLKEEITKLLEKNPQEPAFAVPRKNFIGDYWLKWGGQYPARQIKLIHKRRFEWEEAEVHPRAQYQGLSGAMENPLLHYTYRNFADVLAKLNGQTTLEARKWIKIYRQDPKKARKKMNTGHAIWRTFDRFMRYYVGKKGWRDGFYGFMLALVAGWYQIISYAKYRDMMDGNDN